MELESEIRKLIDEYKTSLAQGVSKLDTGEEMLGLVVEDLEKIVEGLSAAEGEGKQLTEEDKTNAALYKPFHKAECECAICFDWHDWQRRVISGQ